MGEEVPDAARDRIAAEGFGGYGRGRVSNWEVGLPTEYELFPLTKPLVSPGLAADFRIGPQPSRTAVDVDREVQKTINNLLSTFPSPISASLLRYFVPSQSPVENNDEGGEEEEDVEEERSDAVVPCVNYGIKSPHPKRRRIEALSILRTENSNDGRPARSQKRPRVVWKPQLRKLFVDVATRVGTKNAVPKTIMQLMNVEGLTRENVASHLQKYRIYLRSKEGLSNEGPSSSDCAFASTLVPQSLQEHHHQLPQTPPQTVPLPYTMLTILPMPVYSVPHGNPRSRCPSLKATRWVGISMDLRLLIIQELLGSDRWIGELV